MTGKKLLRIAALVLLMAITLPAIANNIVPDSSQNNSSAKTEDPRVQQMSQRLEEIKGMDKSELTRQERKNLRKEVREMKKEAKAASGGVYLSVGAIIIIILLLILIL